MHARVTTFSADASRLAEANRISEAEIIPRLREQPGFHAIYVLVDRDSGEGLVVTIWDSAEREGASRGTVAQSFARLGGILTGPPSPSRVYGVVDQAVAAPMSGR